MSVVGEDDTERVDIDVSDAAAVELVLAGAIERPGGNLNMIPGAEYEI